MTLLEARIHRKTYPSRTPGKDHTALTDLSFSVPEGQFTCIVGPSGCGKTTLLNIIAGLDTSMEGTVRIGGVEPRDGPRIGYMFQTPRLLPWLTVLDNVRLVADARTGNGHAERLLRDMQLGDVLNAFPNRLSGGMQRRVALARAFVIEPRLLLLDEPFISLDAPVANRLRRLLLQLWSERPTTVLFVTHDLQEALYLADRILFMSHSPGRIVLDTTVDIPRPRHPDDPAIREFRERLLRQHPNLLAGLIESAERPGPKAHIR